MENPQSCRIFEMYWLVVVRDTRSFVVQMTFVGTIFQDLGRAGLVYEV